MTRSCLCVLLIAACGDGGSSEDSLGGRDTLDSIDSRDGKGASDGGSVSSDAGDATADVPAEVEVAAADLPQPQPASPGCGQAPEAPLGGVQLTIDAGPDGDGERSYYLTLPPDYDPDRAYGLLIAFPGTNWMGAQIRGYFDFESRAPHDADLIFVYPDPLWRDFEGWGTLGGWVLGPYAQPADGMGDVSFTAALLDRLEGAYCVDRERVFVTGHSWGGDMAQILACFLGDRVRASAPVAANRPYWFEDEGAWIDCPGDAAVWTFFGEADDHFYYQAYPGEFGDECRDFWLDERSCEGVEAAEALPIEGAACEDYEGCEAPVRYCLYGSESGHQAPSWFSDLALDWFLSF